MTYTAQAQSIIDAITAGFAAGGKDEWDAPEFAAARTATEGLEWDFDGWQHALDCVRGGKLAGEFMTTLDASSSDAELMAAFDAGNNAGNGEPLDGPLAAQRNSADSMTADELRAAIEKHGGEYIRAISTGSNAALMDDGGELYVVCDIYGPWAVRVAAVQEVA